MKPTDNIKNLIAELKDTTGDDLDRRTLNDVFAAMDNKKQHSAETQNVWRIIMRSNITKLATAAVIIAAILVGINRFGGSIDGSSVAWAHVTEKVNQIHTAIYNLHVTTTGGPKGPLKMETEAFFSSEYGLRTDMYMNGKPGMTQHVDLANKTITSVMPEQKIHMNMKLTDEQIRNMNQKGNGDPRYLIEQFLSLEYTELGFDVIDGVEVEGIETSDPRYSGGMFESFTGRLWVDVETGLPVRLEMETQLPKMGETEMGTMSMIIDSFQWDIDIDPTTFEPDIPDDYTSLGDMKIPTGNEQNALEGLKLFAEMTEGRYLEKMNAMTAMKEAMEAVKNRHEKKWQSKLDNDPDFKPTQEEKTDIRKGMEKLLIVQGACTFYAELVKTDKDAAYYGDIVTADDPDAVLMRWKVYDGQYRVIFGDLTIENVTADQLAELESQLPLPQE